MKQQLTVMVNGTCYEVEIEDLNGSPLQVTVNGKPYTVEVTGGEAVRPAAITAVPVPARVTPPAAPVVTYAPAVTVPAAPAVGGNDVRAPMPGIIHDVAVKPGDQVTPGQQICTLEAMKMKSAIRTSKQGVVASVEVTNGQKVAHSDVIIRFA